jgi:hypothetical protein
VTTTKSEASKANGGTLARDTSKAIVIGKFNSISALDTSAELESRAVVELVSPVDNLSALEVVRPDSEGASASGASKVARQATLEA